MNGFDLFVIIVVAFCLIRGFSRGLIKEVSGIIGVIAAFYGANTYYPLLLPQVGQWIETPATQKLVSFFLLFCGILLVVGLAASLIRKLLQLVFMGWVDRGFGLLFGLAKGVLIVTVIFILITTFLPRGAQYLANSRTTPYLTQSSDALIVFASKNMRGDFLNRIKGMKK
ncbi:MAG: CvpA family protein [Desulfobacterales bacterium]|nr:CvpA family protein [Desulfobacterales bacterium]